MTHLKCNADNIWKHCWQLLPVISHNNHRKEEIQQIPRIPHVFCLDVFSLWFGMLVLPISFRVTSLVLRQSYDIMICNSASTNYSFHGLGLKNTGAKLFSLNISIAAVKTFQENQVNCTAADALAPCDTWYWSPWLLRNFHIKIHIS